MSMAEDPVDTVVRLLNKKLRVIKEDGGLAKILVTKEWFDRELAKNYDGLITVGLAESRDTKIDMSGKIRRRIANIRVNVWVIDKPDVVDAGRLMRYKMVEDVNRVVRENRAQPHVTEYNYVGLGWPEGDPHKIFQAETSSELNPGASGWTELSADDYYKVWYSDDNRYSKSTNVNGAYALMLFRFKIESRVKTIKKIVLAFEGYGTAPDGYGVTIKVWNHTYGEWQNAQNGTGETDETISITLTENISDYIDDDGYCWLLARTTNPSNGSIAATIYSDFCSCTVKVNGITYLDIASYRDLDRVDAKPFIFRTEFILRSWLFELIAPIF